MITGQLSGTPAFTFRRAIIARTIARAGGERSRAEPGGVGVPTPPGEGPGARSSPGATEILTPAADLAGDGVFGKRGGSDIVSCASGPGYLDLGVGVAV